MLYFIRVQLMRGGNEVFFNRKKLQSEELSFSKRSSIVRCNLYNRG